MNDTVKKYREIIENALKEDRFPEAPNNLYDPLRYFLQLGGKRMRPIVTLMAADLFSDKSKDAIPAAMSIELFHNFSLIHDDIMDAAPLRRNQATVHAKWNENIGILSGDALLIEAYKELTKYPPNILAQLLPVFNETAILVCEGQQFDMDFETAEHVEIDAYIDMIKKKTAVLLGCSLQMGAIVGGADEKSAQQCYDFGVNLGISFQLQDDLLDVYADQAKFGKQVGGDILANKKTYLYLKAFDDADEQQKLQFKALLTEQNPELKVSGVKAIYDSLNIPEKTEAQSTYFYNKALENLAEINCSPEKKQPLKDLADYLLHRQT
jgi:geranylgeranyl diphosphate synthase type II